MCNGRAQQRLASVGPTTFPARRHKHYDYAVDYSICLRHRTLAAVACRGRSRCRRAVVLSDRSARGGRADEPATAGAPTSQRARVGR